MHEKMDYLRNLLKEKESKIQTNEEKEKIENLKFLLSNDDIFFDIDLSTAVGILHFLGIPENEIKDLYYSLISPESFKEVSKPYFTNGTM